MKDQSIICKKEIDFENYYWDIQDIFLVARHKKIEEFPEGYHSWKIHVSANYKNFKEIAKIVLRYCQKYYVSFKYIYKQKDFLKNINVSGEIIQSGKFFTIYPKNIYWFKKILMDLSKLLNNFEGPFIMTDKRFKNSKVLYYRYGLFIKTKYNIMRFGKHRVKDERKPHYSKPIYVEDIFPKTEIENEHIFNEPKLIKINNAGGVFETKNNQIIKAARHNIGNAEGETAVELREREKMISEKKYPFFPKFIEKIITEDVTYFIFEKKQGENLNNLIAEFSLIFNGDMKKNNNKIKILVLKLIELLVFTESKQLIMHDIKPENFIFDIKNNNIYIVDLESSFYLGEKLNYVIDSPYFARNYKKEENYLFLERQKIGYMIMSILTNSNIHLIDDNTGEKSWNHFLEMRDEYDIPINLISVIYELIYEKLSTSSKIMKNFKENIINKNVLRKTEKKYKIDITKFITKNNYKFTAKTNGFNIVILNHIRGIKNKKYKDDYSLIYKLIQSKNKVEATKKLKEKIKNVKIKNEIPYIYNKNKLDPSINTGSMGLYCLLWYFGEKFCDWNTFKKEIQILSIWREAKSLPKIDSNFGQTGLILLKMFTSKGKFFLKDTSLILFNYSISKTNFRFYGHEGFPLSLNENNLIWNILITANKYNKF